MALGRPRNHHEKVTSLRRSQVISTYGIGALIPVASESFIMMGQDAWPLRWIDKEENRIRDITFAKSLNVDYFVVPPDDSSSLPVRRFPEWVSCPKCHRLASWSYLAFLDGKEKKKQNYCRFCGRDSKLITSRFVAACASGHIEDFPYFTWVHEKEEIKGEEHQLYLKVNSKDDSLKGLRVECSCGVKRTLEGALGRGSISKRCSGNAIWLKDHPHFECTEKLVGLQRGATRVWQAETKSRISIEIAESDLERKVGDQFENLLSTPPEALPTVINFAFPGENGTEVLAIFERLKRQLVNSPDLRQQEYEAFQTNQPELTGEEEFVCVASELSDSERVRSRIQLTSQVPRMKEIRALVGFSRVDPREEEKKSPPLSQEPERWLPAIEVFGEGIFLNIDEKALSDWETSEFAKTRAEMINKSGETNESKRLTTPRQLLLHSLSHALLNELALITGYPASSIAERVFAEPKQSGIFLYTATSDSAGSLGGLCAQGAPENLIKLLENAIQSASWCSADPVCIESHPHGVNHSNLAACHYCMLTPEVSCENRNLHLDRACLVGTPESPNAGFFSQLV